jgi:hypothetical protein
MSIQVEKQKPEQLIYDTLKHAEEHDVARTVSTQINQNDSHARNVN